MSGTRGGRTLVGVYQRQDTRLDTPARRPVTVVIVDSHPLARLAVANLLEQSQGIQVVGQAIDAHDAGPLVRRLRPRVVIMDVAAPEHPNLAALTQLSQDAAVLVVTSCADPGTVRRALRAGASGYLVHGQFAAAGLHSAVEAAARGQTSLSPGAVDALVHLVRGTPEPAQPPVGLLSEREAEVMDHIVRGTGNSDIASLLHLSEKTVRNHVNRIYAKLGARTRAQAIAIWLGTSRWPNATGRTAVLRACG